MEFLGKIMKRILLSAIATVALAAPALAADLAARPCTKAPPPVIASIYDWSGFHIGLNGGGGSSHKCWDITNSGGVIAPQPFSEGCHNATGGPVVARCRSNFLSAAHIQAVTSGAKRKGSGLVGLA